MAKCHWTGDVEAAKSQPFEPGDDGCDLDYTYLAEAGPDAKSYGEKDLTLTLYDDDDNEIGSCDANFKVYFERDADDDGKNGPNWFEYWPDDGAVTSCNGFDYDGGIAALGEYRPSSNKLVLGPGHNWDWECTTKKNTVASDCPGSTIGENDIQGIDCVENTCVHERKHQSNSNAWKKGGQWSGKLRKDKDGDKLPNLFERLKLKTSPKNADSCDMAGLFGHPPYASYGDDEYTARLAAEGARGVEANDWANPGKQADKDGASRRGRQLSNALPAPDTRPGRDAYDRDWAELVELSPSLATSTALHGPFSFGSTDPDEDGLVDDLLVHASVDCETADYSGVVGVWLSDASEQLVAFSTKWFQCTAVGSLALEVPVTGSVIASEAGVGPFRVQRLTLQENRGDADGAFTAILENPAGLSATPQLSAAAFAPPPVTWVAIVDSATSSTLDLTVHFSTFHVEDDVTLQAALQNRNTGELLTSCNEVTVAGPFVDGAVVSATIECPTDALTATPIVNGPYNVVALRAVDDDDNVLRLFSGKATGAYDVVDTWLGGVAPPTTTAGAAVTAESTAPADTTTYYNYYYLLNSQDYVYSYYSV